MNRRQFLAATGAALALGARAAEDKEILSVAVIGHTGQGDYGHGLDTMWLQLPETRIVAVADANAKGLAAAQKKLKLSRGFADYHKMLSETRPDIVAIAPRAIGEHRDMALAAVAAGARGIYVEKPFCRTAAEADEIVAACDKAGVKLAIAHRNRYHPAVLVVQRMIEAGAIGKLLELRGRGKEDERGGALDLWVLGSHVLNLACVFAGAPVACSAMLYQGGRPALNRDVKEGAEGVGRLAGDEVHARFEMERGVPLFFDSIRKAGVREANFGLQLVGSQGIIDLRVDTEPLAHLAQGNPFHPPTEPRGWVAISSAGPGKPEPITDLAKQVSGHLLAGRDLIAAIRENRQPLCSARDGRVTVEMIMAVFESHRQEGRRVALPLKERGNPL